MSSSSSCALLEVLNDRKRIEIGMNTRPRVLRWLYLLEYNIKRFGFRCMNFTGGLGLVRKVSVPEIYVPETIATVRRPYYHQYVSNVLRTTA